MARRLSSFLRIGAATGLLWAGIGAGPVLATGDPALDELARQVNGSAQRQARTAYDTYLRHLNAFEAAIDRCTAFLRQYGDRDRIRASVLRQREQPGDILLTAPEDIETIEAAIGRPIDLTQLDLEICSRARDQGLTATGNAAGLAALGDTVGKCLASLKRVGPNAAGVAVLQNVSRGVADPTYTSAATLPRLERTVGNLPITALQLETCTDAFQVNVVVEQP
jgi:hypothetical protein